MPNLNRCMIMGHLGKDPEVRYTNNGNAVANFSVAVSEKWKDKSGDENQSTEWFNVVIWNKLAEICGEYLKKGSAVYLEGKIQTRKWEDKDGQTRYTTELVAHSMQMLGGRGERSSAPAQSEPLPAGKDEFEDDLGGIPF